MSGNSMSIKKDYVFSNSVSGSNIQPIVNVDLNTGKQIGLTSDASLFPGSYDYQLITSYNAANDPLIIQFWTGGAYNTGTGVYTGGTLVFTQYMKYDGSNRLTSLYVLKA